MEGYNNIKTDEETGYSGMDWILPIRGRPEQRDLADTIMNHRVP
jgi:hypothetical protein